MTRDDKYLIVSIAIVTLKQFSVLRSERLKVTYKVNNFNFLEKLKQFNEK